MLTSFDYWLIAVGIVALGLLLYLTRTPKQVVRAGATIQFWGTNAAGAQGALTPPEGAEQAQWWVGNKHRFTEGIYRVVSVETQNGVLTVHCVEE